MTSPALSYHQLTIRIPSPFHAPLVQKLAALGSLGAFEHDGGLVAFFPFATDLRPVMEELSIIRALVHAADPGANVHIDRCIIAAADWNMTWKQGFRPIDIGDHFTVLPPWEQPPTGRIPLIIDPGMAFGTGHHETTRSCLVLMERHAPQGARKRFLDLGTGTGLLAIAALRLGFQEIDAIDHDEQAVETARLNIALNHAERIALWCGDISTVGPGYEMITANLIAGTLVELAPGIAHRLAHRGIAILSGILRGQEDEVVTAMGREGLECQERLPDGKWISLAMLR